MIRPSFCLLRPSSIAPAALAWIRAGAPARVLHAFERSCNLIDARGGILSLVTEEIGDGPFNAVLPGLDHHFHEFVHPASMVSADASTLRLGGITVDLRSTPVWNPGPDWSALHASRHLIRRKLREWIDSIGPSRGSLASSPGMTSDFWEKQFDQASRSASHDLSAALRGADQGQVSRAAERLAGLGEGLTPAGDDILMGALHAAWIIHASDRARVLGEAIVGAARSRTTSLSLAWLEAAAHGEASIRWHRFLRSLLKQDRSSFETSASAILATGHTSGMAAMRGFAALILPGLWEWPTIRNSVAPYIDFLAVSPLPLN